MTSPAVSYLRRALLYFFMLFAFSSAFSIAISQFALGLTLVCFLTIIALERYQPFAGPLRPFYLLVGLYIVWLFVSAAFGETPLRSMISLKEEWLFCIVPVGIYLFQDERYSDRIVLALASGLLLASLCGILQHFSGEDWILGRNLHTLGETTYRLSGFFSYPLTYGNYMATATLFLLGYIVSSFRRCSGWKRALLLAVALLALIATILANSRGPALALGVGLLALGVIFRKLHYAAIAVTAAILIAVVASPGLVERFSERIRMDTRLTNEASRLFIWSTSLKVIQDHPVVGVGLGNFEEEYARHLRNDISEDYKHKHAHCDVLNVAAIAGFPGLVLFLGIWGVAARFMWRTFRAKGLSDRARSLSLAAFLASVAFAVCSLTEATFADEEVRQLLMFTWAAGLVGRQSEYMTKKGIGSERHTS